MKTLIITLTAFFVLGAGHAATGIDAGFGVLKMDEKIESVQKYLSKSAELWSPDTSEVGGYITSAWIFDHVKGGLTSFHAQSVKRIEVYFNSAEESDSEDIYSFYVYMEKTKSEDAFFAFTDKLTNVYGESMIVTSPFGDDLINMSWFTEKTLMTVNFGIDEETGEEKAWFVASFNQAYGG